MNSLILKNYLRTCYDFVRVMQNLKQYVRSGISDDFELTTPQTSTSLYIRLYYAIILTVIKKFVNIFYILLLFSVHALNVVVLSTF